jgi:uncharacterized protein DUF3150
MSALNEVFCVNLDIRIWSGRKKLTAADLHLSESSLPPKDLASLGNKRICDPALLKPLHRIEGRARDACQRVGVHFLSGYGVPKAKAEELVTILGQLRQEFDHEKHALLDSYEQAITDWIAAHPGWEHALKDFVPRDEAAGKFGFDFQIFAILHPFAKPDGLEEESKTNEANHQGLQRATDGLPEQLYTEIALAASDAWKKSFAGKLSVTRKALRPIKAALVKLESMRFLDPGRIGTVVCRIRDRIADVPKSGPIDGQALQVIKGIVYVLSDVERLKLYAQHLERGLPLDESSLGRTEDIAAELSNTVPLLEGQEEKIEPDATASDLALPLSPRENPSFYW